MYPGYTGPVVVRGFVDLLSALDDDNDEMFPAAQFPFLGAFTFIIPYAH